MHSFQAGVTAEVPVRFGLLDSRALEPPTAATANGGSPVLEIPGAFLWIQHGTNRLCDASSWTASFFLRTMTCDWQQHVSGRLFQFPLLPRHFSARRPLSSR